MIEHQPQLTLQQRGVLAALWRNLNIAAANVDEYPDPFVARVIDECLASIQELAQLFGYPDAEWFGARP